jgi:propionate CoA-transferase
VARGSHADAALADLPEKLFLEIESAREENSMRSKIVTADEAIALIRDGDTLASTGFVQTGFAEALLSALERRFVATGSPNNLTLFAAAGQGDGKTLGLNHLGHEGLLRRVVAGHWGRMPKVAQLAFDNRIQAYNLPQGIICQLFRDLAAGKPGSFSKVGLHTFVDPRYGGSRINAATTKDIVSLVEVDDEEWLFYKVGEVNVAFIRGTTADTFGNITMEREALTLNNLAMAMAAKNSNGIVIAQVERIAERSGLPPRQVKIPGILVDCVVVAEPAQHMQTLATQYNAAYAGEFRVPAASVVSTPLTERKIIARRAAFELPPNGIINLGVGMPEGVAAVANEERISHLLTLTVESGLIGGIPSSGGNFGTGVNMDAVIDENQQFDFYDGGGLDMACLGMAECDAAGNVNVSRFGGRLTGAGGFINISQNARLVVFVGTFTGKGLEGRGQGRQTADRSGGPAAEVPQAGRADHLQWPVRLRSRQAGLLRHRTLRLPSGAGRTGADRGGAGHRRRPGHSAEHGLRADHRRIRRDGCAHLQCQPDGSGG